MKLKARRTKKRRNRKVRQTNRRNMFKRSRRIAHSREIRLAVKESFIKLIKLITRNRKEDAL